MSAEVNQLPEVIVKKKWINFGNVNGEQVANSDDELQEINENYKKSLEQLTIEESSAAKLSNKVPGIHLPPPPKPIRSHLSHSPASTSSFLKASNHHHHKSNLDKQADRSKLQIVDKSTAIKSKDNFTLNIEDTLTKSNSVNLQNVPLKDTTSSNLEQPIATASNSTSSSSSRFSKFSLCLFLINNNY